MLKDKFKKFIDKIQSNNDMDDYMDANLDYSDDYSDSKYVIEEDDDYKFDIDKKFNEKSEKVNLKNNFNFNTDIIKNAASTNKKDIVVKVIKPLKIDDWRYICDDLVAKNIVIINYEGVSSNLPQRITDYVAGACYVLNAKFRNINQNILIVVPDSIKLEGDIQRSLNEKIKEVTVSSNNYDYDDLDNLDNLYN